MSKNTTPLENEIKELMQAAEAGNAAAQTHLGWCYDEGEGVEVDHEKAFYWYLRSAELGDATGQFNLAMLIGAIPHKKLSIKNL